LYDGQENWLGYFLEEQQSYLEAIRDFEDDIYMVKGQYQSITKIDGIWMGNAYQPVRYGDMLKIFTTDDITFRWHNPSGGGGSTKETQMATNYLWTEEEDYIPVIVEFVEMDLPREIGVFAEEECVGAAVVEDSTIIICTYITDDPSVELEFDLYYGRSLHNVRMKPAVTKQPDNSYFRVSINGNLNQCPVPLSLYLTNYPNPFNPTTVIEYGLVEAGKVDLSIYNIKGQLVKKIIDGQQDAGMHSVNWNGKDENNNSVASGVYFSIMKAGKEIIRNRMLLLK
jgi:hypothetical protein